VDVSGEIIKAFAESSRPLVVCDVDEVVLEFLDPFDRYLNSVEHRLHPDSFRLHGNIRSISAGIAASDDQVEEMQEAFFASQDKWQTPAPDVVDVLKRLAVDADIVFLTAMPPRHHDVRRTVLDMHGLTYPMIATEEPKGPVVASLIGGRDVPSVFIDDILRNHGSVRDSAPDCLLIHLMVNAVFRKMLPKAEEHIVVAEDWADAERVIRERLGLDGHS
jgi:hypothetical protein